jgi:cell division protein FtsQ
VQIKGEFKFLDEGELKQVIAPLASGGFFQVDVQRIQEALVQLPWVDGVSIRRIWPDTISVSVDEQVPLTRWNEHSLLNQYGEAFTPSDATIPQSLPLLSGPDGREKMMALRYAEVETKVTPLGLQVTTMRMDERRAWAIGLSNGMELLLGKSEFDVRLQRFLDQYPGLLREQEALVSQVDLRYTNGFSVVWKPEALEALQNTQKVQ